MVFRIRQSNALAALSLTPLIDVVFLLLIFFLLSTQFADEEQELDVELPSVTEARPLIARPNQIHVNIDDQGRYFLSGEFIDLAQLENRLATANLQNPVGQTVIIRADGRCPFNLVAAASDACHRAGIHDIRLHSRSK